MAQSTDYTKPKETAYMHYKNWYFSKDLCYV